MDSQDPVPLGPLLIIPRAGAIGRPFGDDLHLVRERVRVSHLHDHPGPDRSAGRKPVDRPGGPEVPGFHVGDLDHVERPAHDLGYQPPGLLLRPPGLDVDVLVDDVGAGRALEGGILHQRHGVELRRRRVGLVVEEGDHVGHEPRLPGQHQRLVAVLDLQLVAPLPHLDPIDPDLRGAGNHRDGDLFVAQGRKRANEAEQHEHRVHGSDPPCQHVVFRKGPS